MSESLPFETVERRGVTVVHLPENYTSAYENTLADLAGLLDLARTAEPARMVVDLRHVRYIGSAFIGFLISLSSRLQERPNGRLALSNVAPFIRMALQKTRSDMLLQMHDSLDDAVEELATY
jgi:anti-anti-sigma factor